MAIPHLRQFAAFSVIGTVALMPLLVLPAMVGVLVDNAGMSDSTAGWSASVNFMASAAVGLLMALRIHHLNLRQLTTLALVVAIAADVASAVTAGNSVAFFAARAVSGVALGATYVSAVSSFARLDSYERGFGLYVTLQFIVSGLGLYVVPVYADQMGAAGLFLGFAVLDGLALAMARHLPADKATDTVEEHAGSEMKVLLTASAMLAVIGFAAFEAANNAQFTYVERFGVFLDIPDHQIGFSLLIASLAGIPGAFSIVIVGHRFGTLGPLIFGMLVAIAGLVILVNSRSYGTYFIGSCFMGYSWAFCLPFIQSLLASIDRKGSAIAAGTSFSTFGSAVGPGLAAIVVVGENYINVFLMSIGIFVVTLVAFFLADRTRRPNP